MKESVREYYGQTLQSNKDLQTSACCVPGESDPRLAELINCIHPAVQERFYGCGSPIPPLLDGLSVLDLGSGAGRDSFILSKLVGPFGKVLGVDMTAEQLAVAREYIPYHTKVFGYSSPNVQFIEGDIEDLASAGIANETIDVVISNCVINLAPDKARVFQEIFRVLKPGGELYFSDVFSGRRIPGTLKTDPVLLGECLAGALYIEDFRRILNECGCPDYRVMSRRTLGAFSPEIEQKIGHIDFYSVAIRAFKLPTLEDRCEDYGQLACYRGTVPEMPHSFRLDDHHLFEKGRPVAVCGNTASMLSETRYSEHFEITGDRTQHFGLFDCGAEPGDVELGCC